MEEPSVGQYTKAACDLPSFACVLVTCMIVDQIYTSLPLYGNNKQVALALLWHVFTSNPARVYKINVFFKSDLGLVSDTTFVWYTKGLEFMSSNKLLSELKSC